MEVGGGNRDAAGRNPTEIARVTPAATEGSLQVLVGKPMHGSVMACRIENTNDKATWDNTPFTPATTRMWKLHTRHGLGERWRWMACASCRNAGGT